jgi:hypothetical protein
MFIIQKYPNSYSNGITSKVSKNQLKSYVRNSIPVGISGKPKYSSLDLQVQAKHTTLNSKISSLP